MLQGISDDLNSYEDEFKIGPVPIETPPSLFQTRLPAGIKTLVFQWCDRTTRYQMGRTHREAHTLISKLEAEERRAKEQQPYIFAGDGSVFAINIEGSAFSWGNNRNWQLGHADTTNILTPSILCSFEGKRVKQVSLGRTASLILLEDGSAYAAGYAEMGELGKRFATTPERILALSDFNIIQVSLGLDHALFLTDTGQVYASGSNQYGQYGVEGLHFTEEPVLIEALKDKTIVEIVAGDFFSLVRDNTGRVWSTGYNQSGVLGLGVDDDCMQFEEIIALRGKQVTQLVVGPSHCLALTLDGRVYSWGDNDLGQLGHGFLGSEITIPKILKLDRIKQVSAGREFSMFLSDTGQVYVCGKNESGALGIRGISECSLPTKVLSLDSSKIIQIAAGDYFALALDSDGSIHTWGAGDYGNLGHGDTVSLTTPKKIKDFRVITPPLFPTLYPTSVEKENEGRGLNKLNSMSRNKIIHSSRIRL